MKIDRETIKAWSEPIKVWSETTKNLAQVLVWVAAGMWLLYLFWLKETPFLEARANVTSALRWAPLPEKDVCKAIFEVALENSGNASYEIAKVQVRAWVFNSNRDPQSPDAFLDLNKVQGGEKLVDVTYPSGPVTAESEALLPFIGHYPPGHRYHHTFELVANRSQGKGVFFRVDFYTKAGDAKPKWFSGSWGDICSAGS